MKRLKEIERQIDEANVEYTSDGLMCLYCKSYEYNGKVGVVHKDDCAITLIRELINE